MLYYIWIISFWVSTDWFTSSLTNKPTNQPINQSIKQPTPTQPNQTNQSNNQQHITEQEIETTSASKSVG